MHDLCVPLAPLALLYGAAAAGLAVAHLLRRWYGRGGRHSTWLEAVWAAGLPGLAVLLLPLGLALSPALPSPAGELHHAWHRWEEWLHASSMVHGSLHVLDLLLVFWAGCGVYRLVRLVVRMRVFLTELRKLGQPLGVERGGTPVYQIPAARPLCLTAGCWQPAIYLTAGLEEQLLPEDRKAVLAHEAAHARRRDPLVMTAVQCLYALIPLPGSALLLRDLEQATERACDQEAAQWVGSPHAVARALVRVAQVLQASPAAPGVVGFASRADDVEGRVRALLAGPDPWISRRCALILFASGLAIALADGLLPHLVELLVHH